MFARLGAALRRPRLWLGLGVGAGLGASAVGMRLLAVPWLVIAIALLVLLLALLIGVLVRILLGQERRERREGGIADYTQVLRRRVQTERGAAASALARQLREAEALLRERLGDADALPWLLLIGEPGAGKSSLLAESGLDWAEAARPRVLGPTAGVDVRIAEQLVAVDVAGRLFAGGESDDAEWRALLGALGGARRARALHGVVFALPAGALLGASAEGLADGARQLRRRLNELRDSLGIDAPVYLIVTKADVVEGFIETAQAAAQLRPGREREAFGWTNDRDRGPFAAGAAAGLGALAEQLDRGLAELLLREPEPERRRRIFGFPQELGELAQPLGRFIEAAFRPSKFDEMPFLRGVYLTSARPQGQRLSRALARLGHEWARSAPRGAEGSGWFERELFAEIAAKDANLALPESRLAPLPQRLLAGAAAVLLLGALVNWGFSFAQNLGGVRRLARAAALPQVGAGELDALRQQIDAEQPRAQSAVQRFGFRRLAGELEGARERYVRAFEQRTAAPLRERLSSGLAQRNPLPAALALGCDLAWREAGAQGGPCAPQLEPYLAGIAGADAGFADGYAAYVHWLPPPGGTEQRERERELLRAAAPQLLSPSALETLLARDGRFPSVAYPAALAPRAGAHSVPGLYTREAFEGPVTELVALLERSGAASGELLARFRREYAQRWDASWRRYLLEVPSATRRDPTPHRSPYLAVIDALWKHAQTPLVREAPAPAWHAALGQLRAEQAPEGERAPWPEYLRLLEFVSQDLAQGGASRGLTANTLQGSLPPSVEEARRWARRIAPRGDDVGVTQLRALLELPLADGLAALVDAGSGELDALWQRRIAQPFAANELDESALKELYGPAGELAHFRAEVLDPYFGASRSAGGRPLGAAFTRWLAAAERLQQALFAPGSGTPVSVILSGDPTSGLGGSGFFATSRTLTLTCAEGPQSFEYSEGRPAEFAFRWNSSCTALTLRVSLKGPGGVEAGAAERQWLGPLAMASFLRGGRAVAERERVFEWSMKGEAGPAFLVRYAVITSGQLAELRHQKPPRSLFGG